VPVDRVRRVSTTKPLRFSVTRCPIYLNSEIEE
jgi:hypothetical protein